MVKIAPIETMNEGGTMYRTLLLVIAIFVSGATHAADTVACSAPEYQHFDFWVGNWEAVDRDGKLLGHTLIEKIEQGCVLQEWWRGNGAEDGAGTSLSMYDRKHRLWRHVWTSARGNFAPIDGGWQGDRMLMTGYFVNDKGEREFHRTVWQPIAGGVHHLWDKSTDGGVSWTVLHEAWQRRTDMVLVK
jgi:hypothetical protein